MHYRVSGSIVQKVLIEEHEHASLLRLFDAVPPLPKRLFREGFREELRFIVSDDHYMLAGMLVRAYVGWDQLASAAEASGVRLEYLGGNSLRCDIRIDEWTSEGIIRSLVLAKACGKVAALLAQDAREGIPHIPSEIRGLLQSAFEMYWEESGVAFRADTTPDPHGLVQGSLFSRGLWEPGAGRHPE